MPDENTVSKAPKANVAQIANVGPVGISSSHPHVISRSSDGLFYIDGNIDGVTVRFAVDTGASIVVLNAQDAKRVGLGTENRLKQRIRTASGYGMMAWQRADNIMIAGQSLGRLEVAIMEDGPDVSLLGLNALSRLGSITIEQDQLFIE
ncbi:retropepsin-like aspartic protease family protein [Parasphingorhabdus cellanae]|uniref:TIGR02281 family clan AA aspartic protease n=1 Tax=Parasphingorhabdus cellanae TaxID=2806553 RepID=A0ABX7T5S6_9SPHN|nr:TIGR02281 family clan AA aspartic protease [Parasphingorhabdus cellanae]QTD56935.1 TIGR02281 family clan AA aspartic protease [Parasphingorhabdus cellanae]